MSSGRRVVPGLALHMSRACLYFVLELWTRLHPTHLVVVTRLTPPSPCLIRHLPYRSQVGYGVPWYWSRHLSRDNKDSGRVKVWMAWGPSLCNQQGQFSPMATTITQNRSAHSSGHIRQHTREGLDHMRPSPTPDISRMCMRISHGNALGNSTTCAFRATTCCLAHLSGPRLKQVRPITPVQCLLRVAYIST